MSIANRARLVIGLMVAMAATAFVVLMQTGLVLTPASYSVPIANTGSMPAGTPGLSPAGTHDSPTPAGTVPADSDDTANSPLTAMCPIPTETLTAPVAYRMPPRPASASRLVTAALTESATMIITIDASKLDPNGVALTTTEPNNADSLKVCGLPKGQVITVQNKGTHILIAFEKGLKEDKNCTVEVQEIKDGKVVATYRSGLPKSPVVIKAGNIELTGFPKGQYVVSVTCDR